MGKTLFELKQYPEAIIALGNAIKINPKRSKAWDYCGYTYYYLKKYRYTRECFEQSLAIYGKREIIDEVSLYRALSLTLSKLRRYPEAIKAIDKAVKILPDSYISKINRGLIYEEWSKYE